jgi:hypothetical protein
MEAVAVSVTKDSIAGKCISEIRDMAEALGRLAVESAKEGRPLYEIERGVLDHVLQMGRRAIDGVLHLQGEGDLGKTCPTAEGVVLRRSEEPQTRRLRTIFGEHSFRQFVYSRGAHRPLELRPIDARLGLSVRIASYLLEEFSQLFCVETAFGTAAKNFATVFQQELSVDTLEAISQHMGVAAEAYADTLPVPPATEEAALLVATMDGKGVPLVHEQPVKVKAFESRRLRPGNRRMATLAGVYSVDRHVRTPSQIVAALFRDDSPAAPSARPKPKFKHLSVHFPETYDDGDQTLTSTGAIEACCWLSSEVESRWHKAQPLLLLIDGDHRLWETAAELLPSKRIEILDVVHVSAYVWEASSFLCTGEKQREGFTRDRLLSILQGRVKSVLRGLRRMATSRKLRGDARRRITAITNYFEAHADRMRYQAYLAAGYPIATGVIEGACRHLVKDRMERSGMRWTLAGAKSMLNVRAVLASSHWDEFQATRRTGESLKFHPHRAILDTYQPTLAL